MEQTLAKIKSWPSSRSFYEFWKPIYRRSGNIAMTGDSALHEVPPELKRCLLTLGESNINQRIFLHEPRRESELDQELIFGHLSDGRFLAFKPDSDSPETIYLLSGSPRESLPLSSSMVPLLAAVDGGFTAKVRRGEFNLQAQK